MIEFIKVNVMGEEKSVLKGITLLDLSKDYQDKFKYPIILAKVGGHYKELFEVVDSKKDIEFIDLKDRRGNLVYTNGLLYLVAYAACEAFGKDAKISVRHSIDKGIYIEANFDITEEKVKDLKAKMKEIVKKDMSFIRCNVSRDDALNYFRLRKETTKVDMLKYNINSFITLYKLGGMYDYFFTHMPHSTEVLKDFDLTYLNNRGFVLLFPTTYIDGIKKYEHHPQLFDVFREYQKWADIMSISNASSLNGIVSNSRIGDIIRIDETLQSHRLLNIAKEIVNKKSVRVILMAGPSSSGKTTSCRKLSMYLRSFGLEPREISMDDYFIDKEKTPKDENGEYDFECLEALNLSRFDKDVKKLLDGERVILPSYNFLKGQSEPGEEVVLDKDEVLIIEGIHALNNKVLPSIPREKKFKIYLCPLTILNIDSHNRISTTDNRLLRRMIRDNRTRGHGVEATLKQWPKVRHGEEKYIFPNQDEADTTFNTALIYELGVLKTYAEPLLYAVPDDSPCFEEARRLIDMLKNFLPIPSDEIPDDSLLREFVGGSCFH